MDKEKMFYEQKYSEWIAGNQDHARELEAENANLIFKVSDAEELMA